MEGEGGAEEEDDVLQHVQANGLFNGVDESAMPLPEDAEAVDEEDAICRRTRARFSLADRSLEELEAFLQETDDEGAAPLNVDDEAEYQKFLTSILLGPNGEPYQGDEVVDEDENDADFELEIEEALESDADDVDEISVGREEAEARCPQTRLKRRMRESSLAGGSDQNAAVPPRAPFRPLLPYFSAASTSFDVPRPVFLGGFTDQQISQLHVMIHEHVQLLIQIYSMCVLDPPRQTLAADLERLIVEICSRRNEALARRSVPYHASCFQSVHVNTPVYGDVDQSRSLWTPVIDPNIVSVLDVAPIRLAMDFVHEVQTSFKKYRHIQLHNTPEKGQFEKVPLFPILDSAELTEESNTASLASPCSPNHPQLKKSLAATLLDSTKNKHVALVPAVISKLAWRFYPLFNSALFPRMPPAPAVANRVLFTDAEDGLLAMGLMEYNNNWGAIQKRYLPCKTKHQIFVRQKNRSSSKAHDNPIKLVRRMKNSPLSTEEMACIREALKVFKTDWHSIWKYCLPYRDPALLQRQWRTATGGQKSYIKGEAEKEKRRIYEAKRRKLKAAASQSLPGKEQVDYDGAECADGNEVFIHEAFLADSGPSDGAVQTSAWGGMQQANGIRHAGFNSASSASVPSSQVHKDRGSRIVKLAPDLPPVNLPPSVRVISKSELQGHGRASVYSYITSGVDVQALNGRSSSCSHDNNSSESEFKMHPLLFEHPKERFFLLGNSKEDVPASKNHIINGTPPRTGREDIRTVEVHPLLQVPNSPSQNAGTSGCPFVFAQSSLKESAANSDEQNGYVLFDSTDLSRLHVHVEMNGDEGNLGQPLIDDDDSMQGIMMEQEELSDSDEEEHIVMEQEELSDSGEVEGIVMEQEELSDSDEDSADVEFDCEEMEDSDEDEAGRPAEMHGKFQIIGPSVTPAAPKANHRDKQVTCSRSGCRTSGGTETEAQQSSSSAKSGRTSGRQSRTNQMLPSIPSKEPNGSDTKNSRSKPTRPKCASPRRSKKA